MLFRRKKEMQKSRDFDPAVYKPVLRCSICNGEQVAGFKNRKTGRFEEVRVIRGEQELAAFLAEYGLDHIDKEY